MTIRITTCLPLALLALTWSGVAAPAQQPGSQQQDPQQQDPQLDPQREPSQQPEQQRQDPRRTQDPSRDEDPARDRERGRDQGRDGPDQFSPREARGQRSGANGGMRAGDLDRRFADLFDELEQEFGILVPRDIFFRGDFAQRLHDQMGFGDLRRDLRQFDGTGQALSLRIGDDGVVAQIAEKDANGEMQSRKYEARSLQEFVDQYPEVARRLGLTEVQGGQPGDRQPSGQQRPRTAMPGQTRQAERGDRTQRQPPRGRPQDAAAQAQQIPSGERLGVRVRDAISPDLRDYLGLEPGRGLFVEEVEQGSLASRLGIRARDVLLAIDGRTIGTPADVRTALRAAGDGVTAVVNRSGKEVTLEAKQQNGGRDTERRPPTDRADGGSASRGEAGAGSRSGNGGS